MKYSLDPNFTKYFLYILEQTSTKQEKLNRLQTLFSLILDELVSSEPIHFNTTFSKIAYLASKYQWSGNFSYELHVARRVISKKEALAVEGSIVLFEFVISILLEVRNSSSDASRFSELPNSSGITVKSKKIVSYKNYVRVYCTSIDESKKLIHGYVEADHGELISIRYNIAEKNELFTDDLESIQLKNFPLYVGLWEVEIDDNGLYIPNAFIIEPDYLIDVTSIASCYQARSIETVHFVYKRYLPKSWSEKLLLGNIVNFILDELVNTPEQEFDSLIGKIFNTDPLSFLRLTDEQVPTFIDELKRHFENTRRAIKNEFKLQNVSLDNAYLEPSFLSNKFGLQGRLDFLEQNGSATSIIELKSGKVFLPNAYGLNQSHYVQTLLYDLLIRSCFPHAKPRNFILYSNESKHSLRIAPRTALQQREALHIRNQLLIKDWSFLSPSDLQKTLLGVSLDQHPDIKGFHQRDIKLFSETFLSLNTVEKAYWLVFSSFIAGEHRMAKIGIDSNSTRNGLASLWLNSENEKLEQFNILSNLSIAKNHTSAEIPTLKLSFNRETSPISNFRRGDIVVLYPQNSDNAVITNQIFKATIISISSKDIDLQLRSSQKNQALFTNEPYWSLEHDHMEISFNTMYKQVFEWARSSRYKKDLILGIKPPKNAAKKSSFNSALLNEEQNSIVERMINSEDYYLIWGPPGTGKTSMIIREYIRHIIDNTDENLFVLAFTNRAVDEICSTIDNLGTSYTNLTLRLGSSFGVNNQHQAKLLNYKMQGIKKRSQLHKTIKQHRIVTSTIASIASKRVIFDILPPSRIIVDEASQILEPMIIGLLTKFNHFVLVGDHRQLPAVVTQHANETKVNLPMLRDLGINDTRTSLFERLFRNCIEKKYTHAYAQLSIQGRMHKKIMAFPNEYFYDNTLDYFKIERLSSEIDIEQRMMFHHVENHIVEFNSKTNQAEAEVVVSTVKDFLKKKFSFSQIGIITPYRAQIATIKEQLSKSFGDCNDITVDTVERYQGSARDVIIISLCCNSLRQLNNMTSVSVEGIDRKLNVALSRAREYVYIIGNRSILEENVLYKTLINDYCYHA